MELKVETPIGEITVDKASDPNYPGVYVSVNGVALVLVEYEAGSMQHVVRVWNHKDPDNDYEYKQEIEGE